MWQILKTAVQQWSQHRSARMGAALAYYSVFSMGPLLLIVTAIAGLFFGQEAVRQGLAQQFASLLGQSGGQAIEAMLAGANSQRSGLLAASFGLALLLLAATGVVVQLKDALNTIWDVTDPADAGAWWYVRTYLVSFAGIIGLGFLLAVSLAVSTGIAAFSSRLGAASAAIVEVVN